MANLEFLGGLGPKVDWVRFHGTVVDILYTGVVIAPTVDSAIHIRHAHHDVAVAPRADGGLDVYIKVGAKRLEKDLQSGSHYYARLFGQTSSRACGGNPSECIGGVEYCCNNGINVGSCTGETQCP